MAIPLVAQLIFLGILLRMHIAQKRSRTWAMQTQELISRAENLFRYMAETQSALRGLILTGDADFRTDYELAFNRLGQAITALEASAEQNPRHEDEIKELAAQAHRIQARVDQLAQQKRARRDGKDALRLRIQWEGPHLEQLRERVNTLVAELERTNVKQIDNLEHEERLHIWAVFGAGILALASTLVLAWLFYQGISRRLRILTENARLLGEGKELAA